MYIELYGIQIILLYLLVCTGDHAAAIQFKIFYIFDIGNKRYVCKKINRSAVDLSNGMYVTSVGAGVHDRP